MKAYSVLLALALGASALATPCEDICNGSCDGVQVMIGLLFPEVADLVAPNINTCKETCATVCTCTDACSSNCEAPYTACLNEAIANFNPLGVFGCQFQHFMCVSPCNFQCSSAVISGAVQNVQSLVSTFVQGVTSLFSQLLSSSNEAAPQET